MPAVTEEGDHPRTRGVYYPYLSQNSPILWIIPAHAGFTTRLAARSPELWDHPRTRGVYPSECHSDSPSYGSSPHTRGLLLVAAQSHDGVRIIPAHAGFTHSTPFCEGRAPDHPRTRGVYNVISNGKLSISGSSPHTRGLRSHGPQMTNIGRIIPAHAGFTTHAASQSEKSEDHPRTRGVYNLTSPVYHRRLGSSPHTRGLLGWLSVRRVRCRIIPAHAGFTTQNPSNPLPRKDHPRTRGVYAIMFWTGKDDTGSSPHTRGLLFHVADFRGLWRIIPAHAGFT